MDAAISLRYAAEEDRTFIASLEKQVMHDYAVALWGSWKDIDAISYDLAKIEIIMSNATRCGILSSEIQGDCYWIQKIYLRPEFQGRGIGKHILDLAKRRAVQAGMPLRLSVLTTNPAYEFYQREGLVEISRTSERILMQWQSRE